jgi:hypothetical protein
LHFPALRSIREMSFLGPPKEEGGGGGGADDYRVKYTGLGSMLKRVVENRATIEKEVPPEKATKVSPARVDIPRDMD